MIKVMTYELQSVEHEEGINENLDYWFGVLIFISFLPLLGFTRWWNTLGACNYWGRQRWTMVGTFLFSFLGSPWFCGR